MEENWVSPSNARTVNWQATDCVPLAHVELQTVLELLTEASFNTAAQFELLLDFCLFVLLLDFDPILDENWVGPSNARTVNWQATDCVPLAHVELQTVLELFLTEASFNASAQFELFLDFCLFVLLLDFGLILAENWVAPAIPELSTGKLLTASH